MEFNLRIVTLQTAFQECISFVNRGQGVFHLYVVDGNGGISFYSRYKYFSSEGVLYDYLIYIWIFHFNLYIYFCLYISGNHTEGGLPLTSGMENSHLSSLTFI